jgi:hypothetical protein
VYQYRARCTYRLKHRVSCTTRAGSYSDLTMTTPCHVLKAEIASASRTLATSKKLASKGTAIDIGAQQSAL